MRPVDPPPTPGFTPGPALNKQRPKDLVEIPGRPGWWRNPRTLVEQYIEPPRPELT